MADLDQAMRLGRVLGRGLGLAVMSGLAWETLRRGVSLAAPGILLSILDGANLIFHEAGHVLFALFGEFLQVLGGSLTQVVIPAMCAGYFFLRRQPSAAAAALFWTGESITSVSIYVADAQRMVLPLLGGDGVTHDWNYLLGRLNLLDHAEVLGRLVFGLGGIAMLAAVGLLAVDFVRTWNQDSADT